VILKSIGIILLVPFAIFTLFTTWYLFYGGMTELYFDEFSWSSLFKVYGGISIPIAIYYIEQDLTNKKHH
jgi:hypothetical protein